MTWRSPISLLTTFFLIALSPVQRSQAANTTCMSKQLDWYTSVVGESPCMTYQRLRQICNNDYQVPSFARAVPGDQCTDQLSTCCCNTIAFQLSMLCLVCQQDRQDTGGIGIDAPVGSYDSYRKDCPAAKNNTLPDNVQRAVCNNNIRLDNFLYGGWDNGAWFYVYTKEYAELAHASNNNTFTHCPRQAFASSTPKSVSPTRKSASSTPTSTGEVDGTVPTTNSSKAMSHGALIGGVVGGVVGMAVIVVLAIVWVRMRLRTGNSKGSQWWQNPRFGYMFSSVHAAGGAPKSSLAQSRFSSGGPLSSFSYRDSDYSVAGSCATSPRTTSSVRVKPPPLSQMDEKPEASFDRSPLSSNPRSFSEVYGTASSEGSQYSTTHIQSHRDDPRRASVSLSTFDFAGSQAPDDEQTTRSFPRSVTANGHTAVRSPSRNDSHPPAYGWNTRAPESRDRSHYT